MSTLFGTTPEGNVEEYIIKSEGIVVHIILYGATITRLMCPDKTGAMGDVVLGYESLEGYLQKDNPYFGCIAGRYANRIAKGKFSLDGKDYQLAINNGVNSLHGGDKGFDKMLWRVKEATDTSLHLFYDSPDGEEGYPANVHIEVIYSLEDSAVKIKYIATTDKATPINLTNHSYFNLSAGREGTIENHELMLNADRYTEVDDTLMPTGHNLSVASTGMDFRAPKKIGKDLASIPGGYDHNFVLNKTGNELSLAATLYDSESGRYMQMQTTEPGVQFYSGNFLDGTLTNTKNGAIYTKYAGLCLEAQHFPDSPNQPTFPNTILRPGETYAQTTIYSFSVK